MRGEVISFDPAKCGEECVTIGNLLSCKEQPLKNANFKNDWTLDWTIDTPGSITGTNPATLQVPPLGSFAQISQEIDPDALFAASGTNCWKVVYKFTYYGAFNDIALQMVYNGNTYNLETPPNSSTDIFQGEVDLLIPSGITQDIAFRFIPDDNSFEIGLGYIFMCPCNTNDFEICTDWGFQMPMYESDIVETGGIIGYFGVADPDIGNAGQLVGHDYVSTFPECTPIAATPWDANHLPTIAGADGDYWFKYNIQGLDVVFGSEVNSCPFFKSATLRYKVDANIVETVLTDYNPSGDIKATLNLTSGNDLELEVQSKIENDANGNGRIKVDALSIETKFYEMFTLFGVPAKPNSYYRIRFSNVNTRGTIATFYDGTPIPGTNEFLQIDSNDIEFDHIIKTPSTVGTFIFIRLDAKDFINTDIVNFHQKIWQNFESRQMFNYVPNIHDCNGQFYSKFDLIHYSYSQLIGNTYHRNVWYHIDVNLLSEGNYYVNAEITYDTPELEGIVENYQSQCIRVCENALKEWSQICWNHNNVKCLGDRIIDNVTYPFPTFLWVKTDFQDMSVVDERITYRRADGYTEIPYVYQQMIQYLLVHPLPEYARRALFSAFMDKFSVDGIEYQKISEEDIEPYFSLQHNVPMRLLVHKVGDFALSRNKC